MGTSLRVRSPLSVLDGQRARFHRRLGPKYFRREIPQNNAAIVQAHRDALTVRRERDLYNGSSFVGDTLEQGARSNVDQLQLLFTGTGDSQEFPIRREAQSGG